VHLVGFTIEIILRCTALWTSKKVVQYLVLEVGSVRFLRQRTARSPNHTEVRSDILEVRNVNIDHRQNYTHRVGVTGWNSIWTSLIIPNLTGGSLISEE